MITFHDSIPMQRETRAEAQMVHPFYGDEFAMGCLDAPEFVPAGSTFFVEWGSDCYAGFATQSEYLRDGWKY